jgi:mannose-6-phosphate isomerase-like protein (cupin superfamily)
MQTTELKPLLVAGGEWKRLNVLGDIMTCKVASGETKGAHSVLEGVFPPEGGPPLHVHENEDEVLYIVEGEYEMQCGDQTFKATKGAVANNADDAVLADRDEHERTRGARHG